MRAETWGFSPLPGPRVIPLIGRVPIRLGEDGWRASSWGWGAERRRGGRGLPPDTGSEEPLACLGKRPIPSKKAVETNRIAVLQCREGDTLHMFESDDLYKMWEDLLQMANPAARDVQLRKMGNYKFENFETIPLFDVFIEVVVDPRDRAGLELPRLGWRGSRPYLAG